MAVGRVPNRPHTGVYLDWVGEYGELQQANRRLAVVMPLALLLILGILYAARSFINTFILIAQIRSPALAEYWDWWLRKRRLASPRR
jgi:Cu/Ag efflux pump CusA